MNFSTIGDNERIEIKVSEVIASIEHDQSVLEWEVNVGREEPKKRWAVLGAASIAGLAGLLLLHHPLFALVGFIAIIVSSAEAILPLRYRLDSKGAGVKCGLSLTRIDWGSVRQVREDLRGVKLSPLADGNRLEPFRGVYLRYGKHKEGILAKVREHWTEA